ncbi:LysR family transcriptional regulator [Paraferrimonas haliotis]|uniref:LysR family transcriptional regulator n=1 Tax=Paraferrimonas haliotis TaxID=2013866 RepID=A0AA37TK17_9GAMM|nr:LysR family transcriptional regulator [Paraferrimonas haliotis]GLS82897.1 LysR family transcriptional regulator [Paraferrimonas haliotis]
MALTFSQIDAFCLVAEHQSVSKAARHSGINRTTLTMAIKAMEAELGVALFERSGNKLSLAEAGKAILRDCSNLSDTAQRIRLTCKQVRGEFAAEVWIARDDSLPDQLWQELTHQLNGQFPATSFNFILASTGDLANLVATEQVDFAFGVDYEREQTARVSFQPLGKIRMMSVCNAEHPLAQKRRVSDQDLQETMQASMVYLNEKDNPELQPFSRNYIGFSSFDYILSSIQTEQAWGVMPEPLIRSLLRQQKLNVIKHTYGLIQEDYCMFSTPGVTEHLAMNWLAEQLQDYLFAF